MEKLIELLKQIQELAGVGVDALQGAAKDAGGPPAHEGAPPSQHGGPPPHDGASGAPMHGGGEKPPPRY